MITLFIQGNKVPELRFRQNKRKGLDFSISSLIQMRVNMDCKLVKNNNGIYLTYNVSNIDTIMEIINQHDDLPVTYTFNYIKQTEGNYYLVY